MNATVKPFSLLLLILGMLTINGCKKEEEPITEIQKFNTARAKWNASNISNYTFKTSMSCFCVDISTYEVTVTNKAITSVKNTLGQEVQFTGKGFKTIDEFFQYIETTLAKKPFKASIKYNLTFGYPTEIYFDLQRDMIDEEMQHYIKEFQPK